MNLFDLHSDAPTVLFEGLKSVVSFAPKIQKQVQTYAIFVRDDAKNPYRYYSSVLSNLKSKINFPINDLFKDKSVLLAVEGGAVLEGKRENLFKLFLDGIMVLSLTWNGETALAGGVNTDKELTRFGKTIIS